MCGCGQPAPLARQSETKRGFVRGQPLKFINGHHGRSIRVVGEPPNPSGLCQCGCGALTPIAKAGDSRRGIVAGEHIRFAHGHASTALKKGRPRSAEERRKMSIGRGGTGESTIRTLHSTLAREHPKIGVCEECGTHGKTEYAFQRHPEPHTSERGDYRELCTKCHKLFDAWLRPPDAATGRFRSARP
jgi:hypothetical protein